MDAPQNENKSEQGSLRHSRGPQSPPIPRKPALALTGTVAFVAVLVLISQLFSTTEQLAENWIAGVAACIAGINILLTFYLLRTAQIQLATLRDDLHEQSVRHQRNLEEQEARRLQEAQQARADLENTQRLLETQTDALSLARTDAQAAQRETTKARLDISAPKCSIKPVRAAVMLRRHGLGEIDKKVSEDIKIRDDLDEYTIGVTVTLEIMNWGDEPIHYSLGGGLVAPSGSFLLDPKQSDRFNIQVSGSLRHWMRVYRGEVRLVEQNEFQNVGTSWVGVLVPVSDIGNEIVDTHTWGSGLQPIVIEEMCVVIKSGEILLKYSQLAAFRSREYVALRSEVDVPQGETNVGP